MVSYYRPIETLCPKCTIIEIWWYIALKSHKNLPRSHLMPMSSEPLQISAYVARNSDLWSTFLPGIVWVYLHSYFYGGLQKTYVYCIVKKCILAIQCQFGSSKVTDFGTNRKHACNFVLVLNSNLGPMLHCFGDTAAYYKSKIRQNRQFVHTHQSHKSPSLGVTPFEFRDEPHISKNWNVWALWWWRNHDTSSVHFDTIRVTDRRMDRHVAIANTAICIASCR